MILGFPLLASQRVQQFYKAWASIYRPKVSPRQVGHPATVAMWFNAPEEDRKEGHTLYWKYIYLSFCYAISQSSTMLTNIYCRCTKTGQTGKGMQTFC